MEEENVKNNETKKCLSKKILCGLLCAVIAIGCMLIFPQFEMKTEAKNHTCNYVWKTLSKGSAYEDLYEIKSCEICGEVQMTNYKRAYDFLRERMQSQIKLARKNWVVVNDLGFYHTLHDEVFVWLTERNDVTLVVTYEYEGTYYQTTFPAGADYSEFLLDDVVYYGMPGLNGRCGITSTAGGKIPSDFPELVTLEGAEGFYFHIKMAPAQETVYASYGDNHTIHKTLLTTLSERSDVTAVIFFEYKGMNFKTTFPAGADYTELLNEGSQFFGLLGVNGRCGIVTEVIL